jgi:hypothetical protein
LALDRNRFPDRRMARSSLIFFFAGLAFSFFLRYTHFTPPTLNAYGFGSDSDVYWDLAGNLTAGRGYVSSPGLHPVLRDPASPFLPNISTAPGYPFLLAAVRTVWNDIRAAYILQWIFYAGLIVLAATWPLNRSWTPGWRMAALAGIAFWPGFLLQLQSVSSELATAFFAALLVWSWCKRWLALSVVAAIAAVALRSNMILFIIPWVLFEAHGDFKQNARKAALKGALLILCLMLFYAGWSFRNKRLCGEMVFSAYAGQVLYAHYLEDAANDPAQPLTPGLKRETYVRQRVAAGESWSRAERNLYQALTRMVIDEIRQRPFKAALSTLRAWTGFFLDSYFRIPDLLWAKVYGLTLIDNRKIDPQELSPVSRTLYWAARVLSLALRLIVLVLFLFYPLIRLPDAEGSAMLRLWCAVFLFLAGTAIVSGAGDRQLLPVAFFVVLFAIGTTQRFKNSIR